ncbi:MAG: corrinoid protein [Gallionella sp.]|nr:corrinoid protein [Gallionella sp.]
MPNFAAASGALDTEACQLITKEGGFEMTRERGDILKDLMDGVFLMNEDLVIKAANEIVEAKYDAYDAINNGLIAGMNQAGVLFDQEEYFVPELLICSDAMYAGIEILRPHLKVGDVREKHKVVIGVVEGDTHDIGKNLVKIMMDAAGFEVHDLGRNVPLASFVEKAKEVGAKLICLSTLMTTTMDGMATVIEMLKEEGIRDSYKVIIGGGPISQAFANKIGADGYADNAAGAIRLANSLLAKAAA